MYTARESFLLLDVSKHNGIEVMKFTVIQNRNNVLYRWQKKKLPEQFYSR